MSSFILASLLLILGVVLIALSSVITENTKDQTVESLVSRCNQGIYTMGIVFLSIAITLLAFGVDVKANQNLTLGLVVALGVVLLVLSAIIVNKTSGKAKDAAIGILVSGIVFIVSGVGIIVYLNKSSILPSKFRCY